MVNTDKIIIVGDRVLIRPSKSSDKSHGGLYLPPSVVEKEKVQSGYIIKTGPGYPLPSASDEEFWKEDKATKYISLQAKAGDFALFLKKDAIELELDNEKLIIVPHTSILLLLREDDLVNF
ncbi:MAG: chaperonin [Ignavibacteriae bacterium HGW-Ignavibacteriae-2]|nr:co-chaperone GroES family protein [Bacteroidota bacterium]PKL88643.1 MAG: chaperonin [Ignavibacteriae bacterium HGW-Ignavibacteriae-2]